MALAGPWLLAVAACKEPNPDFDGAAESANDTGPATTSTGPEPTTSPESTGPVVTSDGTSSSGEPPSTSSGEPPGTSSGEPGDSTTEACVGMVCEGVCVDTMTDNDNCGMCGNNCVGQQECVGGECIVP
jgi:hypothetical protein